MALLYVRETAPREQGDVGQIRVMLIGIGAVLLALVVFSVVLALTGSTGQKISPSQTTSIGSVGGRMYTLTTSTRTGSTPSATPLPLTTTSRSGSTLTDV